MARLISSPHPTTTDSGDCSALRYCRAQLISIRIASFRAGLSGVDNIGGPAADPSTSRRLLCPATSVLTSENRTTRSVYCQYRRPRTILLAIVRCLCSPFQEPHRCRRGTSMVYVGLFAQWRRTSALLECWFLVKISGFRNDVKLGISS